MKTAAALALVTLLALPARSQDKNEQPLQVKKIVVYKHGVGYFEREGKVRDNQKLALTFKSAQMKDLLKSLYAVDLSGGKIATIQYDTKDPLSKQLEDILIRVPEQNALTQFLTQLKGAPVEIRTSVVVKGRVIGIEPVVRQTKDGTITTHKVVIMHDTGFVSPIDLEEIKDIKVADPGLERDLSRLLDVHAKAKHADRKSVVLDAQGAGERNVRVGYIIETPIWKTSYRLLFEEGNRPLLQGWAILENTTDEDWEQVDVSFVAGSPMSFIMDLYTAYYPERAEIPVGVTAAPRPHGLALAEKAASAAPMAPPAPGFAGRQLQRGAADKKADRGEMEELAKGAERRKSFAEELENAVGPAAAGVDVGDLFAYQAREKVSVKRGQAALVPILSERVEGGERVLFYRPSVSSRPMNSYYFKNTTSLTLEAGPVTFFDGSTCIGEGLMRRVLKKDMKEMMPYAVEAGVKVETKVNHRNDPITRGRVANGVLHLTYTQNLETVYALKNQLTKDTVLYLDHAKAGGYSLAEPAKAEEEVDGHYRFKVELKAGTSVDLKVRETMAVTNQVALLQSPQETVRFYMSQRYLSEAAKKFLGELAQTQGEINRLRAEENDLVQERNRLNEDDARVRQNLAVLRETAGELEMRKKYLQRLGESDARLDEIKKDLKDRATRRAQLERDLAKKVQEFRED